MADLIQMTLDQNDGDLDKSLDQFREMTQSSSNSITQPNQNEKEKYLMTTSLENELQFIKKLEKNKIDFEDYRDMVEEKK